MAASNISVAAGMKIKKSRCFGEPMPDGSELCAEDVVLRVPSLRA